MHSHVRAAGGSWLKAHRAFLIEDALFSKLEGALSPHEEKKTVHQIRRAEIICNGLDFGVIAAVYAISAAGGIPVSSCNGGCFASRHSEPFPVIAFHWPSERLPLMRQCAKVAGVSMWVHRHGELVIGADYIRRFLLFADALLQRQ